MCSSGSGSDDYYTMASGEMTFALNRSCGKSLGFKVTIKSAFPSSLQRQNGSSLGSEEISRLSRLDGTASRDAPRLLVLAFVRQDSRQSGLARFESRLLRKSRSDWH